MKRLRILLLAGLAILISANCRNNPTGNLPKEFGLSDPVYTFNSLSVSTSMLWPEESTIIFYGGGGIFTYSVDTSSLTEIQDTSIYFATYEPNSQHLFYTPTLQCTFCSGPVYRTPINNPDPEQIPDIEAYVISWRNVLLPESSTRFFFMGEEQTFYLYDNGTYENSPFALGYPEAFSPDYSQVLISNPELDDHSNGRSYLALYSLSGNLVDTWLAPGSGNPDSFLSHWDENGVRKYGVNRGSNGKFSLWIVNYPDTMETYLWEKNDGNSDKPDENFILIFRKFIVSDDYTKVGIWETECIGEQNWVGGCEGDFQSTLWVYDINSGNATKQLIERTKPFTPIPPITFSPDGNQIAFGFQNELYIQNVK